MKWHRKVRIFFDRKIDYRFFFTAVDTNELQRVLNEIKSRVNSAQLDLDNAKNASIESLPGDLFVGAMEVRENPFENLNQ